MFNVISKPADQIGMNDIKALIASQVPEGEQIEFKECLAESGKSPDPWMERKDRIGDRARNKVLEEAVAFANAHGGALIIGIKESDSKPPVATEITPVPRCVELADRLKLIFRDCVEPQIPRLEVFGVPTNGESGVVMIRVGRSRLAPHRVEPTRKCTVRRADRCESMTMREIQDMTLNVSRGMERFEKRLVERSEGFQRELGRLETPDDSYGLRFTALPVGEEVQFDRVFHQQGIIDDLYTPWRTVIWKKGNDSRRLDGLPEFPPIYWRPILRGARADIHPSANSNLYTGYQELHCDGLVELGFAACNQVSPLDPDLPLVLFANTVVWANYIRRQSSVPLAEYGLEVEIHVTGNSVRVGKYNDPIFKAMTASAAAQGDDREVDNYFPKISNVKFPKYSLDSEETPAKLLSIFNQDFSNWLGKYIPSEGEEFEISE